MADDPKLDVAPDVGLEVASPWGRKFLRIFLMAAGGLAAPCLALAAFFVSNSGGADRPAAKSAAVVGGRVRPTTSAKAPAAAPTTAAKAPAAVPVTMTTTTSTTATTTPVPARPTRDPFVPLLSQGSGTAPAH